ncbi:MAG TPA: hypothetical protein VIF15_02800 [Polyangiaceae bacterium]
MRTLSTCTAIASLFVVVAACGPKQPDPNAAAPTATAYPGQYPPGQYPPGQYPQGQYPQPTATQYAPQPTVAPPAPTPTTAGTMAVPGPIAFQCQNDVPCGTHHCNTQYGKCAFPCQSAVDCITPNQCIAGLCVPAPPQAH